MLRSGDHLHDDVGQRARACHYPDLGLTRLSRIPQGLPQAVQGLAVFSGELRDQGGRVSGTIARRPAGNPHGRGPAGEPFEGCIGVRAGDPGGVGDGISGGGSQTHQRSIHQGLGRREAERRQVDGNRHLLVWNTTTA